MSSQYDPPTPLFAPAVRLASLMTTPPPSANWLWDGYLARGKITLLTSLWKMGKTTLLSVLLAKTKSGGELAGRRIAPARPVVISEEAPDFWAERAGRLGLDLDIPMFCQPFRSKPTTAQWQALLESIVAMSHETQIDLLVIDPLATFLPGRNENHAGLMLEALLPLKALTCRGISVLLLHHPRKAAGESGRAPRGSGALTGYADILLELRPYSHAEDDRRRRLCGASRFVETPRQVVIEWNETGTDYICLGEPADEAFASNWDTLLTVLSAASDRLTRREIWLRWPIVEVRPEESTLWRWLEQAVAEGTILRSGSGRCNSPFKYWLKDSEERWKKDPFFLPMDPIYDHPDEGLPPLFPPSMRKLLERRKKAH